MRNCAWEDCNTEFEPKRQNQIYCCILHGHLAANARRKAAAPSTKICPVCGQPFQTTNRDRKYCDKQECKREGRRRRERIGTFEEPREFKVLNIPHLPDGQRILIICDLHRPFHDKGTLEAVEHFWNDFKPNLEIYLGDLSDLYEISDFDRNPSRAFRLQDECDDTRAWLHSRAEANPDARRIWNDGNHEDRLRRWLWRHGPALSSLRSLSIEELLGLRELNFEYLTYRSRINLLGFLVEHGYRTSLSAAYPTNVARLMGIHTGSSGACGHSHRSESYSWSDARGSHSYHVIGCLSKTDLEFAPFPSWTQGFVYAIAYSNKLHVVPAMIYQDGFVANGEHYPRRGR